MISAGRSMVRNTLADAPDVERRRQAWRDKTAERERRIADKHDHERVDRAAKRDLALAYEGPRMVLGDGDRRDDCTNYRACLTRFVDAYCQRGDQPGHCPTGCAGYATRADERPARQSNLGVVHGGA